ncbi:hypothetical protein HAX54_028758 [Datura stramonium]|uniref:E4 SUMO-protein ligase PIAL2-like n=1 Tax=Datura stramonium TaxID=4076 RepID=A0ABS8S9T4_DATST|nr:hypothetical protein [Datura stramonium]
MEKPTSSSANAGTASMLVATVIDLMSLYMQTGHLNNLSVFSDVCFSLAKQTHIHYTVDFVSINYSGIDHAVANNEVPLRSHELPSLLKQVYKYRNDFSIQEASMFLLMSVKSACKVGWFRNEDADDLLKLIQEVSRYFSSAEDTDVDPSYVHPYVSRVLRRFCPKLRIDRIIAAFQIKPGFAAFHADFHITRGMVAPGKEEILLHVINIDNMETSSCIIAPPETSFLLNGKRLEGTIKDSSLQFPTNITIMLKYGINLLQVVGQFNDLEIVETSSRVSLNCPISNSFQVLNEAGDEIVDIISPSSGSGKPILQDNNNSSQIYNKSQSIEQLTYENKYSVGPPTLEKVEMPNKRRIIVHASIPVTPVKTNALSSYNQQPQRAFLVPSRLATCGERSEMCSAMVNQLDQRIDLKQESLVAPRTNNWIPSSKMKEG